MLAMDQPTSMLSSSKSLTSLGDSANAEDMNRQDIASGAELIYDYGDKGKLSLQAHPWLAL